MAFSNACQTADPSKRPIVYIVDRFVAGPQKKAQDFPRLSQYPPDTLRVFNDTIKRNIDLLQIGKAGALFRIKNVRTLDDVPGFSPTIPGFLGSGDVVLCLAHFPPYQVISGTMELPPASPLDGLLSEILRAFRRKFDAAWTAIADPSSALPLPDKPQVKTDALPGKAGISEAKIIEAVIKVKKTQAQRKVFYNARVGIIDAGFPAGAAVFVWPSSPRKEGSTETIQGRILTILGRSKEGEPDASFGPLAVSWVKQNLDPTVKKESKPETLKAYLEGVGRGLAKGLLHEFWHVTEVTQKHPYGEGNNRIEGLGNALVELQFQPEAVKNMLAKSESTWCKFLTEGRVAIGEV